MKVLFKNVTKYTKENCNYFEEFHQKKYGKKELLSIGLIALLAIYIVIFNIIHGKWLVVASVVAIGALIYLVKNYEFGKIQKEKSKVKTYTFYFYDNYIKVKYKKQFDRIIYFTLHKVFETDKYFYLYTDEKSSLILDKEGFQIGNAQEFSAFIKAKCPLKYHKENKH